VGESVYYVCHNVLMELHGERSGGSPAIAGVSKGEADRTMEIFHE